MIKRTLAILGVLAACFAWGGNPRLRIMPLGDSITEGVPGDGVECGGYRAPLYKLLTADGYTVDFVGTNTVRPGDLVDEVQHEGHGGWRISHASVGLYEHLYGWFAQIDAPHIVLLHIGTNDTNDPDYEHAVNRLDALIDRIVECQPSAYVIVTTLLERDAGKYAMITQYFNPFVPGIVSAQQAKGHTRVRFLDMNAAVPLSLMADQLHPGAEGYALMAEAWKGAIEEIVPDPSVVEDLAPAVVDAVGDADRLSARIVFNMPMDKTSAETLANYSFAPVDGTMEATLAAASLSDDGRTVTLTLAQEPPNDRWKFVLGVNGVKSAAGGVSGAATREIVMSLAQGARRYVPAEELDNYKLVYAMNLPANNAYFWNDCLPYEIDRHRDFGPISRVAYYLELRQPGGNLQYVWVSMDAFTGDAGKIGIPTVDTGAVFQQTVDNLHIWSNVDGIQSGTRTQGSIEFWPTNYAEPNSAGIEGANGGTYDFGDQPTPGNYGSMQVHDFQNSTTLFAYNKWGGGGGNTWQCLGIGNNPNGQPDWTFTENSGNYDIRRLEIYAMPDLEDATPPAVLDGVVGLGRKTATITFDKPISPKLDVATFDLAGVNVVSAKRDLYETNVLYLKFDQPLADSWEDVPLTFGGVFDQSPRANRVPDGTRVMLRMGGRGLPSEVARKMTAGLYDGYKLVYAVDMGAYGDFNVRGDEMYWVDETGETGPFDRVAYYLQLDNPANYTWWTWVSMDAWTDDASTLGIPLDAKHASPASRFLTNLTVASSRSDATLVKGSGFNGFLEFWPRNYKTGKDWVVESQHGDGSYSWGDSLEFGGNHGCFQIVNTSQGQTVFAINHWGADGGQLAIGMGNSTRDDGTASYDWTFRENGTSFSRRRLYVFVHPCATAPEHPSTDVPAEVSSKVDAEGYRLLYKINLPGADAKVNDTTAHMGYHEVDNRSILAPNPVRVGYLLNLVRANGGNEWVWTAFDRPYQMDSLDYLSLPRHASFQLRVNNLDVASNVGDIVTGSEIQTGCLEFCTANYETAAQFGLGGDGGKYDYDDRLNGGEGGYGCMQVHNYGARQTLWAFNHFNGGSTACLGIGNNPNGHPDWTFQDNAEQDYTVRELYVLVKYDPHVASQTVAAKHTPKRSVLSLDRTQICVTFPLGVAASVVDRRNFNLTAGGAQVVGAFASDDPRDVIVQLSRPVTGSPVLAFTWGGETQELRPNLPAGLGLPADQLALIPEYGEYSLVNELHIAETVRCSGHGADYAVDESRFGNPRFDRVAYLMHLNKANGPDRWVWASMDAFTSDLAHVGVPTTWYADPVIQTYVDNLHVYGYSSDGNLPVKTGEFAHGNLEFWPGNYVSGNAAGIPNATDQFDWGDTANASSYVHGHGSMQVCNYLERQVVFAFNAFGRSENIDAFRTPSLGIGNDEPYQNGIDWTHRENANDYTTRDLFVFVRRLPDPTEPEPAGNGPVFQVQPENARRKYNDERAVAFRAYAIQAARYQWRLDGEPLAGQTDAVLMLPAGATEKTGIHTVDVVAYSDTGACTVSRTALLNILAPATFLFFR